MKVNVSTYIISIQVCVEKSVWSSQIKIDEVATTFQIYLPVYQYIFTSMLCYNRCIHYAHYDLRYGDITIIFLTGVDLTRKSDPGSGFYILL